MVEKEAELVAEKAEDSMEGTEAAWMDSSAAEADKAKEEDKEAQMLGEKARKRQDRSPKVGMWRGSIMKDPPQLPK